MNMTIEKARQQVIFEELKVEGDCFPDLTTEAGAFWLMIRLEKWNRKEEFDSWLEDRIINNVNIEEELFILDTLIWLTTDAKDGKSPAIYNAIAEFLDLEVEA